MCDLTNVIIVPDTIEENGKTVRENNLENHHSISLGSKVSFVDGEQFAESHCQEDGEGIYNAVANGTLYVAKQTRDCDGTVLYTLTLEPVVFRDDESVSEYYCKQYNPDYQRQGEKAFLDATDYAFQQYISGIAEHAIVAQKS